MPGAIPGGTMPAILGPAVIIRGISATHTHTYTQHSAVTGAQYTTLRVKIQSFHF